MEIGRRYRNLKIFGGELATVFSATAIPELDMSLISYEGSTQPEMFSNLSIAGILPATKWEELQKMSFY